ncbi:DoxX family protein [Candidatus Pacearchaeota archaeon]|nr:DoxX family protein [Candidatus Pacearchaeota archaeon]
MEGEKAMYGPALLRVFLGILFIIPGIGKLLDIGGPTGLLVGLGFPAPAFFAWVLALSEVIFGLSVLLGWKVKWTVWPLVIVLTVATLLVVIPNMNGNPVTLLFHLVGIAGLISLALTGPGAMAVSKEQM